MRARNILLVPALLWAAAPAPAGQSDPAGLGIEEYARALLDHPLHRSGDWRTALSDSLELLRWEPGHPLSEANLLLLAQRVELIEDLRVLADGLLELDPERGFDPAARRILHTMQSGLGMGFAEPDEHAGDAHPEYLRDFLVLGPIGPRLDARAAWLPSPLFAEPGFDREHEGLEGPVRWQALERDRLTSSVRPWDGVREEIGQVFLASIIEAREGGPAWIEISARLPAESVHGGGRFPGVAPAWAFSFNGAEPVVIDHLEAERSGRHLEPVQLRPGRNQLIVCSSLLSPVRARFAIRVLRDLPASGYARSAEHLSGSLERGELGPDGEALLGVLLGLDHQQGRGLEHLRRAVERAPEAPHLRVQLALATTRASYLPNVWRKRRARELAEGVVAEVPDHFTMQLHLAEILAGEDREEEALEVLEMLERAHRHSARGLLLRHQVLRELGMQAQAEAALFEAHSRSPRFSRTLVGLASHYERVGQRQRAARDFLSAARVSGSSAPALSAAAARFAGVGELAEAEDLFREAVSRDPHEESALIGFLIETERLDEAERRLRGRAGSFPRVESIHLSLARIAQLRGEREALVESLKEARRIQPLRLSTRERLRELGEGDPCLEFLDSQLMDADEVIAGYAGGSQTESVVAVLDHSAIWLFEDGSSQQLTQNLFQVRDLEGCREMGDLGLPGEVLSVATIKASDGTRYEPVRVNDRFTMPHLEPGDFIEANYMTLEPGRLDQVVRVGEWSFASVERAFHLSRYVVSWPDSLGLEVVERNLEGIERESTSEGARTLDVFLARDRERVLPEPGAPPPGWFLPNVSFGTDEALATIASFPWAEARWYARPTPEIREAAAGAIEGVEGDEARARALHRFVREALDERTPGPGSAVGALLSREGNPSFLYLALLEAAGVSCELVWSRAVAPSSDPDPDPAHRSIDRWRRYPLVVVRPLDGPETWCDLNERLLPYGELMGFAPASEAFAAESGVEVRTPARPLADRPALALEGTVSIDQNGDARVEGSARFLAGLSYRLEEQFLEIPEAQRLYGVRAYAAQALRGLEVSEFELPGMGEDDERPMSLSVEGRVRSFLDREGQGWVCSLPMPPTGLRARFAGEGRRRLPFFLSAPILGRAAVRLVLPEGMELVDPPAPVELACPGGTYRLAIEREGPAQDRTWRVVREVLIDSFVIPPEEYPAFIEFCTRADDAEGVRLRFRGP